MRKGNKLIQEGKVPKKRTLNTQVLNDIVNVYYLDGIEAGYKAGYDYGYENGLNSEKNILCTTQEAYQKGLDDAWAAARKLFSDMSEKEIEAIFPNEWNNGGFRALIELKPQEAIEKIREYEEKQKRDCVTEWDSDSEACANSPCHLCRFSPPGSGDGKPCTMCPAEGRSE